MGPRKMLAVLALVLVCLVPAWATELPAGWKMLPDDDYRVYRTAEPLGAWCYKTNRWWPRVGSDYGDPSPVAPVAVPEVPERTRIALNGAPTQNFGLEVERRGDGYYRRGEKVTREEVKEGVGGKRLEDESKKRRIIVVGAEADRKKALAVIGEPKWAVVNAYEPDHWYVLQHKIVNGGAPSITIAEPDGTVIHRQDDVRDLDKALMRADIAYDPKLDPDLREVAKPQQPSAPPSDHDPGENAVCSRDHVVGGTVGGLLAVLVSFAVTYGPGLWKKWNASKAEREELLLSLLKELAATKRPPAAPPAPPDHAP
jgi:hypothetical protein